MKLTPLEIRKQEFKRVMRGLDQEEVEAFLSMVADEFEHLIREKNQLNDELIKLRTQLRDYQQVEQTLRDTMLRAQNTVDESRANSRREAEIIIHEAELQAEHILKEAREDLMRLRQEVSLVKTQKESFARRLRHLLESQIELLQIMEMDDTTQKSSQSHRPESPAQEKPGEPARPMARPEAYEKAPQSSFPTQEEPKIIRGGKKFDEPMQSGFWADSQADTEQNPEKSLQKDKPGNRVSDQFIF